LLIAVVVPMLRLPLPRRLTRFLAT
jgi:hypothetical protein